ncbi:DUF4291 domain-containing protein [Bremerella cremea]|uniref:DUF4291 domain-containing protein n=1 Tax=Blastopirellula marina TaxID=124 RepID=A0A2S8FZL1_9BACT|nr:MULTISPECIES: DUF4291 domain-containing protein [Pirellulaceae]PQO37324.1 DUF4291 domain-containing protein [Blastopirellula marina]RCS49711.1 DUF4291 domain-containing protein [Bremerella cremea]
MDLPTNPYVEQQSTWPSSGRHILAHFDDESIVVYQAYRPDIGEFAINHGYFGGDFKYSRMSWIKPNFLWMMYRSSWGTSEGQEKVLGVRLTRKFFDSLLEQAVPSSYSRELYLDRAAWQAAVRRSDVRLQWDPDHTPTGDKCERRAIQLGLRSELLERYGNDACLEIIDMSTFVCQQREYLEMGRKQDLLLPIARVYIPKSEAAIRNVRLDAF